MELGYDVKFGKHIYEITAKANSVQRMLSRVLRDAHTKTRLVAYKALIGSSRKYECQVWDPHLKDTEKIEIN